MNRKLKPDARAARGEVQRSGEPPSYQLPVAEARRRLLETDVTVLFHCMGRTDPRNGGLNANRRAQRSQARGDTP